MSQNPFEDFIDFLSKKHGEELWVTVYKHEPNNDTDHDGVMYCALVSKEKTEQAMQRPGWDLMIGSGGPGFCKSYQSGEEITTYYTNLDYDFLRLILVRDFHGRKEDYIEILEEFRLFHNLYHDKKTGSFISFDEVGDEVEVIKVERNEVKVRRRYLRSFLAARQMNLLLYFELTRHYKDKTNFSDDISNESLTYTIYSGDSYSDGYTSFSRILGKKLIQCETVEKCGVWPFEQEKAYQDFIIGGDIDEPEMFSCDPDGLANYFGANPDAPHYLTPVFFRKEVMQKYYSSSDYEIADGRLCRTGAWDLRLDNNSPNHVSVFLGDLGRDLPSKEQVYWKSFNLMPDGRKISRTNFERSFLGNFYDAESPGHRFKQKFKDIQEYWNKKYSWLLFLPLSIKDEHFYESLRSMLTNEQSEFDAQVLALTKITIDSINVRCLRNHLIISDTSIKSISLMEALLEKLKSPHLPALSSLLKDIQSVRSTGVAHRKGTEYEKTILRLNIDDGDYASEFDRFLLGMLFLFEEVMKLDLDSENGQHA
ncbi:hypothetical protein SAMN05660284_01778 [Formivibrio citricus]|uniref:Uncharacterized protein n=1 Tax=Formivibrio citricus TaxID=83765 RepID=A0A1I5A2Q5_9NEIS|nr:hypothetical protein [Formivibrio citricus]SFN56590.1 hypothetical protein SAMN05660284_01778 [Formivibrio citricus]